MAILKTVASKGSATARDIGRMEAFSDAVFAIAITLPIVEVRVPLVSSAAELPDALFALWPSYVGYVLSFLVIGVYWAQHHFTGKIYARADHIFNLLNLLFLMAVCFVPFPTRVFTEYIADPERRHMAAIFYTGALVLPAAAWTIKWSYARFSGSLDARLHPAYVRRLTMRYLATVAALAAAFLLAFLDDRLGLGLSLVVTLFYLLPPPAPVLAEVEGGEARTG